VRPSGSDAAEKTLSLLAGGATFIVLLGAAGSGKKIDLVLWVFAPESLQRERDERLRGDDDDAGLPCASSWLETSPT
jgi:hypothetical protein